MNKTDALCPQCGGDLVERKTRLKKRVFYCCSNYPTCNFATWERPVPDLCPNCGGLMVIPRGRQDPVCYTEVVAQQHSSEEKPQQDGNKLLRATRKKTPSSTENVEATSTEPKTTGRTSTTTRKTSTRTSSRKKVSAATSKSATGRAKTAKAK